jgi:hypothetical protein
MRDRAHENEVVSTATEVPDESAMSTIAGQQPLPLGEQQLERAQTTHSYS